MVEQYITCDEVERAIWLLNNPPGWYRSNYPPQAKFLQDHLYKQFFTTLDYAENGTDVVGIFENTPHSLLLENMKSERGSVISDAVEKLNEQGIEPFIFELGPGTYWVPQGLRAQGKKFKYFGPSLNPHLQQAAKENLKEYWQEHAIRNQKSIFICFEMIEHLVNPSEIYHHYIKSETNADTVLLSTPMYTFGGGMGEWHKNPLGHLRTYTPDEFSRFAHTHWPQHKWSIQLGNVMCLRGER